MSSFPEDVYLEIFVRLPRKSIYLCKCVCKSWFHIISCPSFVKIHLNHAKQKNNLDLIMFTQSVERTPVWGISVVGYDSLFSSKESHEFDDTVEKEHQFKSDDVQLLSGHCNGLIYLEGSGKRNMRRYCLWNPATKEYKFIPKSPTKYMRYLIDMYGFGYDCKIDDYKVIHVGKLNPHKDRYAAEIYTLGSNSWKSCYTELDFSNYQLLCTIGVLVNGTLNWLCIKRGKIISFDIRDEKFKEMQPPKEVCENKECCFTSLGDLEGLLCLYFQFDEVQFTLWVMQDYGVQESWKKRFVVTHEKFLKKPSNLFHLCSLDKGKTILFSDGDTLVLYDPKHEYARKIISMDEDLGGWIWNSVKYFESLVSVNSGRYVGGNQEDSDDSDSDDPNL